MKYLAFLFALISTALLVQSLPTNADNFSSVKSASAKLSATESTDASNGAPNTKAAKSSPKSSLNCRKVLEGPVVLGNYDGGNYPNLHTHNAAPADNGNAMLSVASKETWAAYWSCTGFDNHNNTEPSKNAYFGQLRVSDTWCYTLEHGTGGVNKGLVLEECAWSGSNALSSQWIQGSWQDNFFALAPTVTNQRGISKQYAHVTEHTDYHGALGFAGGKPTKKTVAIKYY